MSLTKYQEVVPISDVPPQDMKALLAARTTPRMRCGVDSKDRPVMDESDLHYLRSIHRRLAEFKDALADTASFTLGGQALADEIDWLDCFIEKHGRQN